MGATTAHPAHDRLVADLNLLDRRTRDVAKRLEKWASEGREDLEARLTVLRADVKELLKRTDEWEEVELGAPTQARHIGEELDSLEADVSASSEVDVQDYEVAMDRQVRAWKSRLDALRLQGALASMELKDELSELSHRLDHARAGVLIELQNAIGDSGDLVVDVRDDLETVLIDVRHGLERAYDAVFDRDERT